jgi:hypothetical protein
LTQATARPSRNSASNRLFNEAEVFCLGEYREQLVRRIPDEVDVFQSSRVVERTRNAPATDDRNLLEIQALELRMQAIWSEGAWFAMHVLFAFSLLAGFLEGLKQDGLAGRVVVLLFSEFGRRVREKG